MTIVSLLTDSIYNTYHGHVNAYHGHVNAYHGHVNAYHGHVACFVLLSFEGSVYL